MRFHAICVTVVLCTENRNFAEDKPNFPKTCCQISLQISVLLEVGC